MTEPHAARAAHRPNRDDVLAALAQLQRDDDEAARTVGAALAATAFDTLDDEEQRWVATIEALRARIEASTEEVDAALVNVRGVAKPAVLGEICRRRSKQRPWGVFLLSLARRLAPARTIELGTCLGISSAYLGAGLHLAGGGELVTLEGAPALAERAAGYLGSIGLGNVEVVPGLFRTTLDAALGGGGPIGLAFIDGHHHEEPTLDYFDRATAHLTEPAVVVFDDIRWSEGMERAWARLCEDPRMRVIVDLDRVGVCVVGAASDSPPRVYNFPTVSAMIPILRG